MKKFFQVVGMISLICVSFLYTEKAAHMVKEADSIMITIQQEKQNYQIPAVDAKVIKDTVIPGLAGKEVDENKSYEQMKRYGAFDSNLFVYKTVLPKKTVEKIYDKYIVSGNSAKKMVSLVFLVYENDDVDTLIEILNKKNVKATLFIDGRWLDGHNEQVIELMKAGYTIGNLSYDGDYQDSAYLWMDTVIKKIGNQGASYCYQTEANADDLMLCAAHRNHTIRPTVLKGVTPLTEVKEVLQAGSILSLPINQAVLKELPSMITYIESRGYQLETLVNHLSEK